MDASFDENSEREPLMSSSINSSISRLSSLIEDDLTNSGSSNHSPRSPHRLYYGLGIGTMAPPLIWSVDGLWDSNEHRIAKDKTDNEVNNGQTGDMSLRAKIALILMTVCYFFGYIPTMVIMNPYIYDRIAEEFNFQVKTSSEAPCVKGLNNITGNTSSFKIQIEIERRVSTLELFLQLTTFVTAVLPILLLGPISDKFGRKTGFFIPIFGTMMKQIVYIIVVTRKLPIPFLYLAHAIEALGGSFGAMLSAIFSATSDLTQPGVGRSRWIAIMEAVQTLSATVGQIYTAQWMQYGYLSPLLCALANCCLSFLVAILLLPETRRAAPESSADQSLQIQEIEASEINENRDAGCCTRASQIGHQCWTTIKASMSIYTKNGEDCDINRVQPYNLSKRRLCLAVFICTVAVNFSRPGVEALFQIKYPLCWPATKVYTFTGLRILFSWIAIMSVLIILQKVLKVVDRHMAIIGVVSCLLSNAALSLAVNDAMVYEATVIGFMTRSIIPMLRSTLSALVSYDNQGAMYSSLGCVESLGAGIFSTVANRIFYSTLSSWAGEIFMIFAGIMVLALALLIVLNLIFVRGTRQNNNSQGNIENIQEYREE